MKPTFLIIGAAKCGTTTLYDMLSRHPEIGMSCRKEPRFFAEDAVYARGMAWYESLFEGCAGRRAVGEASPQYTQCDRFPLAAERIARDLPEARLIYIVRHPLARMESHWMHMRRNGRAAAALPFSLGLRRIPVLVDASRYWKQISRYRERFPDERILVLFLEDLTARPQETLRTCLSFLGVDAVPEAMGELACRNAAPQQLQRSPLLRLVRRVPGYRLVRQLGPSRLNGLLHDRPVRPRWSAALRAWAWSQVKDDAAALLQSCGKPLDFWNPDWVEARR